MDQRIVAALPGDHNRGGFEPAEAGAVGDRSEGITQRFDPRTVAGGLSRESHGRGGGQREQREERAWHTRLHYTPPESTDSGRAGSRFVREGLGLSTRRFAQYLGVP